ncbi:D-alanyl-D-alanine carboxypeptidase family protein [Clostridium brassicae]|uniref:D-alanyl-D-alanine carboxypeptidase n=1 Tax=Clostridium brassicae TaxID=2999072 RepID=A0ABT4DDP5_9CLOT|nr:D-alanyl-D-alanine carboxypeptidase family protein [Clostridium brassicae]MCY6960422.1 D-alanyl-D-alanine carboxypeptidase [Clostridium brassicae]
MRRKLSTLLLTLTFLLVFSINAFAANADLPQIYGKTGIVIDVDTGEIVYAKGIDESPMYPASTTKLLTALLFAENKKPTDTIKYTPTAAKQPQYALYDLVGKSKITTNDTMTADDVMKSLLLFSANDAAYMIAESVAGTPKQFEDMMNNKIKQLGLKNTHFVTPNGLDNGINNHYTSAYDLSVIAKEAYKNPWVKKVMNIKQDKIEISNGAIAYITNRNKLLGTKIDTAFADKVGIDLNQLPASNAVCVAGKTGYTSKSGRCLVAIFEKDGRKLCGVVMKSLYDAKDTYVFNDMAKIINWSYAAKRVPLYKANTEVKKVTLKYKPLKFIGPEKEIQVPLVVKKDVEYYDNEVNKSEVKTDFELSNLKVGKLDKDTSAGNLVIKERNAVKKYELYPTISSGSIVKQNILLYIGLVGAVVIVILLITLLVKAISKNSNRRRRRRF